MTAPLAIQLGGAVFGLFVLQRVSEVVHSALQTRVDRQQLEGEGALTSRVAARSTEDRGLYLFHTCAFVAPLAEASFRGWTGPTLPLWCLTLCLALTQVVRLWTMRTLGRGWRIATHVEEGDSIVTNGPYAFVRHPNHAAVIVEMLVLPLTIGAPTSALVLSTLHLPLVLQRVRREETQLEGLGPYRALMAQRPSFFPIPRLRLPSPQSARGAS